MLKERIQINDMNAKPYAAARLDVKISKAIIRLLFKFILNFRIIALILTTKAFAGWERLPRLLNLLAAICGVLCGLKKTILLQH